MSALATATYEWETGSVDRISQNDGRWVTIQPRTVKITAGGWLGGHRLYVQVEGRRVRQSDGALAGNGSVVYGDDHGEPIDQSPPWVQNLVGIVREWERRRSEPMPTQPQVVEPVDDEL